MTRLPSLVCALLLLAGAAPLWADDKGDVQAFLSHEIIGPHTSLTETKTYLDARVVRMPKLTTQAEWERDADRIRKEVLERVVYRGEAAKWRDAKTKVEWL